MSTRNTHEQLGAGVQLAASQPESLDRLSRSDTCKDIPGSEEHERSNCLGLGIRMWGPTSGSGAPPSRLGPLRSSDSAAGAGVARPLGPHT